MQETRAEDRPAKAPRGYVKADDKERLRNRLKRIEGQVRGVQRMVEGEASCVDTLTQVGSVVSALEQVAAVLLQDHVEHCVRESIADGARAEEEMQEVAVAVRRFVRI